MKEVLLSASQSSALCGQKIMALLFTTCFALTFAAPTSPLPSLILSSELPTVSHLDASVGSTITSNSPITSTTAYDAAPISSSQKSSELSSPATSKTLDTVTIEEKLESDDDVTLFVTSFGEELIGSKSEVDRSTAKYDNEMIRIHEFSTQKPSTVNSDAAVAPSLSITPEYNTNISDVNVEMNAKPKAPTTSLLPEEFADLAPTVATTIDIPIKVQSDNSKLMEIERDVTLEESRVVSADAEAKKGKLKESKKKALKAMDKKQKLKQKIFTETSFEATTSTPIKTAPTTIKSTTLTTTKSFQSDTTLPVSKETLAATEFPLMENEFETETGSEVTATDQRGGDNVIVLNTNSSGLIVVDIMEKFGKENSSNEEAFEIKMDLIDDALTTEETRRSEDSSKALTTKDDIFLTTIDSMTSMRDSGDARKSSQIDSTPAANDDIILINEGNESGTSMTPTRIKWNQVKSDEGNGNIKITFDNIDLPNQNVNVSIENGELIIDSIDISVLNRAEEELKKRKLDVTAPRDDRKLNKTDSLEIILIEDDSHQENSRDNLIENDDSNLAKRTNDDDESHPTTIHFELPSVKHDRLKKIELSGSDEEDGIKIKTTDKDSDTVFYISNTEVKVIESIPTASPNASQERKYFPAIYEEDVIVDVPNKSQTSATSPPMSDKYEEDIVLSPLTSDFDPKDINYIGEAFLDVEESQNGPENRHIIPLTSDVVIQPFQLHDMPSVGIPIIGELPPQIELEEMVFSDDYDNKQQSNFRVDEYYPNFLSNRLIKNQLEADVPREMIFDSKNGTLLSPNRTHIHVNTMINGTNMTTLANNSFPNATAFLIESEENENADLNDIQTLLLACFATLMPLFLCVIIALTIRYCWRKYRRQSSSGNDMTSDKSTDPLAEKNVASSTDELKSAESGMMLDREGNMQASTELLLATNGDVNNHTGTNGSIITMTLKNNHLIVETEERNDISRDTRETKMHYSPSEKDGVFIVESARGADQNGSHKPSPLQLKPAEAPLVIPEEIKIDTLQNHFNPSSPEEGHKQIKPEQVEVHTPPADMKPELINCNGTKTGLSQSDLSLTSSNSSNQNYSYGDKEAYHFEEKGYKGSSPKRIINVHCHDLKPLIENSPPAPVQDLNKPIITSAIFKNDSQEDREYLKSDALAAESNGVAASPLKNGNCEKAKVHKVNGIIATMKNGLDEIISVTDENCNDAIISPPFTKSDYNGELNMDSLSFYPAPPEELSNESILELTSMDSLPPPPPEELIQS